MRIFLSYASEDRETAEQVQLALAADGHEVFFDRGSLPPAGDYQSRIREAVGRSEYFIFLVTPESVAKGSFALTELRYARERWTHPRDRVLPVLVRSVSWESIPTYLKAVTILEPAGDVAADITSAVARSTRSWDAATSAFAAAARKARIAWAHDRTRAALRLLASLCALVSGLLLSALTGNAARGFAVTALSETEAFVSLIGLAVTVIATISTWRRFGHGTGRRLLAFLGFWIGGLFLGTLVGDKIGTNEEHLIAALTVWFIALVVATWKWRRIK